MTGKFVDIFWQPTSFILKIFALYSVCWIQALADAMTGISTNAKQAELSGFCDCVAQFANAVCGIVENSSQVCHRQALLGLNFSSFTVSFVISTLASSITPQSFIPHLKPFICSTNSVLCALLVSSQLPFME